MDIDELLNLLDQFKNDGSKEDKEIQEIIKSNIHLINEYRLNKQSRLNTINKEEEDFYHMFKDNVEKSLIYSWEKVKYIFDYLSKLEPKNQLNYIKGLSARDQYLFKNHKKLLIVKIRKDNENRKYSTK